MQCYHSSQDVLGYLMEGIGKRRNPARHLPIRLSNKETSEEDLRTLVRAILESGTSSFIVDGDNTFFPLTTNVPFKTLEWKGVCRNLRSVTLFHPGASDVFLDVTSASSVPLLEELALVAPAWTPPVLDSWGQRTLRLVDFIAGCKKLKSLSFRVRDRDPVCKAVSAVAVPFACSMIPRQSEIAVKVIGAHIDGTRIVAELLTETPKPAFLRCWARLSRPENTPDPDVEPFVLEVPETRCMQEAGPLKERAVHYLARVHRVLTEEEKEQRICATTCFQTIAAAALLMTTEAKGAIKAVSMPNYNEPLQVTGGENEGKVTFV